MVVITKIDICPPQILEQTITQLTKILKSPGARKIPIFIKNREECINTAVSPYLRYPFLTDYANIMARRPNLSLVEYALYSKFLM
jgi:hypothetical protein